MSLSEDTHTDSMQLADLDNLPGLPCSENTFVDGCDQGDGSWSYPEDVTLEEGVNMSMFAKTVFWIICY